MWHRWFAERGQIDAFQLLIERKGSGSQFPFLYHRTERGCNHRTR